MKCRLNNKFGEIQIDTEVIARYAGLAAIECMGIVGMASVNVKDGLVKLLKKDSLPAWAGRTNLQTMTLKLNKTGQM